MNMVLLLGALLAAQDDAVQARLMREVGPSVVALRSRMAVGSGFIVDAKGFVLTNAHVATAPLPFEVEVQSERGLLRFKKVLLVGVHPDRDLALVKIDPAEHGATLRPLRFSGKAPATETDVFPVGFPHGGAAKVMTAGRITATERVLYRRSYFQFDAKVHPGNSGGPVCLQDGSVVGVVTLKDYESDDGLAIPAWEFQPQYFVPLRSRPPDPAAAAELMNEAERCMRVAREERSLLALAVAVQLYEEASSWDPGNGELLLKMGMFQAIAGENEIAAAYLVRGLRINAWPEEGPVVYLAAAGVLGRMRRARDGVTVAVEGFLKYPDRSRELFDILAMASFETGQWAEAARWSHMAIKQGSQNPQDMNRVLQESRRKMTPEENGRFAEEDATFDARMVALKRNAEAGERERRTAMSEKFGAFLSGFEGVQREGGGEGLEGVGRRAGSVAADADLVSDDEVTRQFLDAQLRVAREHLRAGRLGPAKEVLEDIVKTSPKSPQAKDAKTLLGLMKDSRR